MQRSTVATIRPTTVVAAALCLRVSSAWTSGEVGSKFFKSPRARFQSRVVRWTTRSKCYGLITAGVGLGAAAEGDAPLVAFRVLESAAGVVVVFGNDLCVGASGVVSAGSVPL